jgi:hypothetical protein
MTMTEQTNGEREALRVALPFVEEFGAAWLDGSVSAKTALIGVMSRAMLAFAAQQPAAAGEGIREALAWYGEQARLARLIHSEGDAGRHALQADGGKLATAALATPTAPLSPTVEGEREREREAVARIIDPYGFEKHAAHSLTGERRRKAAFAKADAIFALHPSRASVVEDDGSKNFQAGYLIAVANIMNLHGEDVVAEDVLRELGATASVLRDMDLSDYDLKPLRKLFREIERKRKLNRALASKDNGDG